MKLLIDNRELLSILSDKEKVQNEVNKLIKEMEQITAPAEKIKAEIEALQETWKTEHGKVIGRVKELDEEVKPLLNKIERFKEKMLPIIAKQDIELGEFEEISLIRIEDGKVAIETVDKIELYKEHLRNEKNNNK